MRLLREYIKSLLTEKELRGQKDKRVMYHIGRRPASPKPAERWGAKGKDGWSRNWIEGPVKSGVFVTENPTDVAQHHGVSGNVYTYKIPEWVIAKAGGKHRFDRAGEILISQEIWEEAGDEIEFLGKKMDQKDLWDTVDSSYYSAKEKKGVRGAHKHDDGASNIEGLRATSHPETAVKMMSPKEIQKTLEKLAVKYEVKPDEIIKYPGDRKGLRIPHWDFGPDKKDKQLLDLLTKRMKESVIREYIKDLLVEVPLDDFEYVKKDSEEDVMVREEVANYFKAIPQSVKIYIAHTDDLSWAAQLPTTLQGKVSGFKLRGMGGVTDSTHIKNLYPQIGNELDPNAISLLYIYPKSYEADGGTAGAFVADVNPHYLAHDLHHMLETAPGVSRGEDKFAGLIKEYLQELALLSFGDDSHEMESVRRRVKQGGRRLGSIDPELLYDELFPGITKPSAEADLMGDVFANYLKDDGRLTLGVPEQLIWPGLDYDLKPGPEHDMLAQQYEQKFQDIFDTLLDPLVGKVAYFNAFEVSKPQSEKATKQAEEKMQKDHGPILDYIKSIGGDFNYFTTSGDTGKESLVLDTPLKDKNGIWGLEQFAKVFPDEAAKIESLGYEITSAFDAFGQKPVELHVQKKTTNESMVRRYIRGLLTEALTKPEIEDAIADASFNSAKSSQHRWSPRQPIIDYVFDERNGAWKYTATIPDASNNANKWPSFSSDPGEDLETFLSRVEEPIQLNLLEQTDIREDIRGIMIEQNVLAAGMCFPFAYQKAVKWFEDHFTKGSPGRPPKRHPDLNDKSKFKVVHGTVTDKWKKPPKPVVHGWVEMDDLVFDDQTQHTKPNGVEKEFYYETYQPEIKKEFTAEEAIVNCATKGGEGPWDDDLMTQLQQRDAWKEER